MKIIKYSEKFPNSVTKIRKTSLDYKHTDKITHKMNVNGKIQNSCL